jgi:hypothetical protein
VRDPGLAGPLGPAREGGQGGGHGRIRPGRPLTGRLLSGIVGHRAQAADPGSGHEATARLAIGRSHLLAADIRVTREPGGLALSR